MANLTSAVLVPYAINGGGFDIVVELDAKPDNRDFRFISIADYGGELLRGQHEDIVRFYAYNGPGRGFGGSAFKINMADGTERTLIGPWSSRAGVINAEFDPLGCEHVVECLTTDRCVIHVALRALEAMGISFIRQERWGGEIYYVPIARKSDTYWAFSVKGWSYDVIVKGETRDDARVALYEHLEAHARKYNHPVKQPKDITGPTLFAPREWSSYNRAA